MTMQDSTDPVGKGMEHVAAVPAFRSPSVRSPSPRGIVEVSQELDSKGEAWRVIGFVGSWVRAAFTAQRMLVFAN